MSLEKECPLNAGGDQGGGEMRNEPYVSDPRPDAAAEQSANALPDTDAALAFLRLVYPAGPWLLTAIPIDKKRLETRTFLPSEEDAARAWLERWNGVANLYWSVNPPLRPVAKKAEREDIREVCYLHVDCDPRAGEPLADEHSRLRALVCEKLPAGVPPTAIVFSGGGYQAFWKLAEPIPVNGELARAEAAADYNRHLERAFGGDNCHNVDRIMRLPGTVNVPDAKKQKKGRKPALAALVEWNGDRIYPLSHFTPEPAADAKEKPTVDVPEEVVRLGSVDELDKYGVDPRVKGAIVSGPDELNPKPGDNSRSIWLFDVCCNLVRCNVPDDVIYSVITDPSFGISESVLEKRGGARKYALRQIERAKEFNAAEGADFVKSEKGAILANSQRNILVALTRLGVKVERDEFQDRLLISGLEEVGPLLDDAAMTRLWLTVESTFGFRPAKEFFWDVVGDRARRNSFHPVRNYLEGLKWDGVPRLDTWLCRYGGADDTPFNRAAGALFLTAAVRRIRKPGSKFDEMLVMESEQGTDKSSALCVLAVNDDWFSDDLPLNADGKRVIEALAGRWIVEAAELKGMRRGEIEGLKAFLSRRIDRARMSYDRLVSEVPRQCVIAGTTNSAQYLRDTTGNRRFWPVRVKPFDLPALRRDRDQLWAEAASREAAGASIRLDPSLYGAAANEQEARQIGDPYLEALESALGENLCGKMETDAAWTIVDLPTAHRTQEHNSRLGEAMKKLGWERKRARFKGRTRWCYVRGDEAGRVLEIEVWRNSERQLEIRVGGCRGTPF
jgi:predicted P-loop ATPase